MAQNDTTRTDLIDEAVTIDGPIGRPNFGTSSMFMRRNDTVFYVNIYPSKYEIDSVVVGNFWTKLRSNQWIFISNSERTFSITIFSKTRNKWDKKWFQEYNDKYFQADYICKIAWNRHYGEDGSIQKYWKFGCFSHVSEIHPKKK